MKYKYLIITIIASLIMGCASGPGYVVSQEWAPEELAEVSIYRTDTFFHSGNPERPFFYINDKLVAKLGTGMAVSTKVKAGKHIITVRQPILFMPAYESDRLEYEFEKGKKYYIRYSKNFSDVTNLGGTFVATGTSSFVLADKKSFEKRK